MVSYQCSELRCFFAKLLTHDKPDLKHDKCSHNRDIAWHAFIAV